jgi:hypothetical protein
MAGIVWVAGGGPSTSNAVSQMGTFFRVSALPSTDFCIMEANFQPNGFYRFKLHSDGKVHVEGTYNGTHEDLVIGSTAIALNTWYWVSGGNFLVSDYGSPPHREYLQGFVRNPDGTLLGSVTSGTNHGAFTGTYNAVLSLGCSSYDSTPAFPNSLGNYLSKAIVIKAGSYTGGSEITAPNSDWTGTGLDCFYNMRAAAGVVSGTLSDDSTNGIALTPGPNGMTIVTSGPFVS